MPTELKSSDLTLNKELLEKLRTEGPVRTLTPDTVMLDENDYIKSIPIVLSGSIKVFRQDEDGREILLYYIKPGESCIMSLLGAATNTTSKIKAVVEDQAEVLMLPIHKASDLIRENPRWLEFIFQLYNKRFEELLSVVNAIDFQKVDIRLWDFLKTKVEMSKSMELNITHQQIADELGTAREVVSRLLKQLEKDKKLTLSRNKIKILKPM
jgi:CRP/FNR family transcriptional regulator, anaerobic regulatory protein